MAVYRSVYRKNRELVYSAKAKTAADIHGWFGAGRVCVAEIDGRMVGATRIGGTRHERVTVSRFGVHKDWKGSRIGSALLNLVEELARAEDFEAIWLTTPEDHPYLPAFYRDRGCRKTGDHPLDYREYDVIVMEKSLGGR